MKVLPQLFYETPEYQKILVDGLSSVVYKKLDNPVWHKEGYVSAHAITLVLNGLLRIENENGLLVEVPENKMVFLPKALYTISDIMPKNGSFEAMVFFFDEDVISGFINSVKIRNSKEKSGTHLLLDYTESIQSFTKSLRTIYGNGKKYERSLTKIKLLELLHLVHSSFDSDCFLNLIATLNNKEKKGLKQFMDANFSKSLSIEDYAYLTGRTLSTFRRDFKTLFGVSPKKWLIEKRLEKAHSLLSVNNISVTDVVQEIGYENIPHFTKAFHQKYGIAPRQFHIRKRKEILV